jgi:hypothetical protein
MANESARLLPRRSLLIGIGGCVAAGAVAAPGVGTSLVKAGTGGGETGGGSTNVSLAHADYAEWRRHIGSTFLVRSELGPLQMVLARVKALPVAGSRPNELKRKAAFSAHFVSKNGQLPAGDFIYRVMHPAKGELDIYFGPVAQDMSAIFN